MILDGPVNQSLHARLISHGDTLSVLYSDGISLVRWRLLTDPAGNPELWREPETIFELPKGIGDIRFSATGGSGSTLHVAVNDQGRFVGYLTYDGARWSSLRQIGVGSVYGPSVASDGENTWTFWFRRHTSGDHQVEGRRWLREQGRDRAIVRPWPDFYGRRFPRVLVDRQGSGEFDDLTRYVAELSNASGGRPIAGTDLLRRPGDRIYLGDADPFDYVPVSITSPESEVTVDLEYWNGDEWVHLAVVDPLVSPSNGPSVREPLVGFELPQDWSPTTLGGVSGYFVRVAKNDGNSSKFEITLPSQLTGPVTGSTVTGAVDLLWSEHSFGTDTGNLWYGAVSVNRASFDAGAPEHFHSVGTSVETVSASDTPRTSPLPAGSPRQYVSVSLDEDDTYEFQLLDGQVRYVRVLATRSVFSSQDGVTVWATATVEVWGPGLEPARAEIPAAYLQSPTILHDVRLYVEITSEFNDFRLSDGGGTPKAARLFLSDARHSLTDLSRYRWPFPGMIWGLGAFDSYYQTLQGSSDRHSHSGVFIQGVPAGTPIHAWHDGELIGGLRRNDWTVSLTQTGDGKQGDWHHVFPVAKMGFDAFGTSVKRGDPIATVADGRTSIQWGSGTSYDWVPVLAEWYVAHATPVERSFVKDWLVVGPFDSIDDINPLSTPYISNERALAPRAGDSAPRGLEWRRFDGIVPGVVDVVEAVSEFPYSGWGRVNGSYAFSVAYLATYVYSPDFAGATLNVGSSDGIKIWVDDQVVLERDATIRVTRPDDWSIIPDFYQEQIRLVPGWNRILVKLSQGRADYNDVRSPQNAWQLSVRLSDPSGEPVPAWVVSPDREGRADPLANYAVVAPDPSRLASLRPPSRGHEWPLKIDLAVGQTQWYTLQDGSQRSIRLLSYHEAIADQLVEATVEVGGNGRTQVHTLQVGFAGVPVSVNDLRLYAYVWKEASSGSGMGGAFL